MRSAFSQVVIVAALDATFQRKPFGSVLELVPLSEPNFTQPLPALVQLGRSLRVGKPNVLRQCAVCT